MTRSRYDTKSPPYHYPITMRERKESDLAFILQNVFPNYFRIAGSFVIQAELPHNSNNLEKSSLQMQM